MRLFIAIELPDALKERLAQLKSDIPGAAWVRREGYHITLRFLGDDIAEGRVPDLRAALEAIRLPAFEVKLQGVGRFPPKRMARVLWVGSAPNEPLRDLYRAVEHAVTGIGFPPNDHADFSAHVTLARLKSPHPGVEAFLAHHADFRADPFRAAAFHLVGSVLTPDGARYSTIATFALDTP